MIQRVKNKQFIPFLIVFIITIGGIYGQVKTLEIGDFDKIIISPHISATFRKGDTESIKVESIGIPIEKFKTEMEGSTLRIFLEGARILPNSENEEGKNWKNKKSIYDGTVAKIVVTYRALHKLSLR